jgi:hypothetical protein
MVIEGCEEARVSELAGKLCQELKEAQIEMRTMLSRVRSERKDPQELADRIDGMVNQALSMVALRERYPELKDVFVELDVLAQRADEDLYDYGTKMKLPKYVE